MRNYKKEIEWRNKKYISIQAWVDRELGTALKNKLKNENIPLAKWVEKNAEKYLES